MPATNIPTRRKADSDESIAAIIKELEKPGKYSEGTIKGLFLQVTSTSQLWRFKFSLDGKEGLLAVGQYPEVSIPQARQLAQDAREAVAVGIHPLRAKTAKEAAKKEEQRTRESNTFQKVAEEWLEFNSHLAPKTLSGHRGALKNHLYPVVGDVPVAEIAVRHVRTVLERLAASPTMARYSLTLLRMILGHAMDHELVSQNVAVGREGLLKKHKTKHHAALEKEEELAEFLRRLNNFVAYNDSVISALWLLVLLPVRPAELTSMKWEQVDLEKAEWRFVVPKTKQLLIVPLPDQAVAQLRALQEHSQLLNRRGIPNTAPFGKTAASEATAPPTWVFPSSGKFGVPISADTLLVRIRTGLGYERGTVSSHGFRSSFRSLGHGELKLDPIVLELCLGHRMPGALGATYARAQLLDQRRLAMQAWADYIEGLWEKVTGLGYSK
ncbi:tyrosine-type recombinase/integrase [Pseudomonas sp. P9_31]|uniref:tyrosine-type recombinase/integrase n=1 Tax=Pseudomonas sp. P9_31 TaxID=3043448 RepID=UPI002A36FA80|nr:integrase arm-type DNA-binding domain-containing protein [Pseudomonas sp. P9_31]WPN59752.1 integrase arm-type DNA-binding domain-containing protein [Pseudomonas sp. P9_31]